MKKIILLSAVVTSYMFAGIHGEVNHSQDESNVAKYSWVVGSSEDNFKAEAGRRRGGKGNKGRRRGGNGLR